MSPDSTMRRLVLALLGGSLLALAPGCKSSCRLLSEKQCDCTTSTTERTSCLQVAANKENSGIILTAEDEETCKALLDQCDCRLVDTPAGKERCGFAVSTADAGL